MLRTCVIRGVPPRSKRRKQPWLAPPTCQQSAPLPALITYSGRSWKLVIARGRVTQRGRRQSGGADDAVQPRQRAREALDDALGVALSADEDNGCQGQGGSHMNWAPMRHWKQADGAVHAD